MDNERVNELCERIDNHFKELAEITGAKHISACYVNGSVSIDDLTDLDNMKFDYYRSANNE